MSTHSNALDQSSAAALDHILELTERHGGTIVHDLSDPLDVAYLSWLAHSSGMSEDRYPALFNLIAHRPGEAAVDRTPGPIPEADNRGDQFTSNQLVDFVGRVETTNTAKGHATFTRTKPLASATVWLTLVNDNNGVRTVLAKGQEPGFAQQTLLFNTPDAGALQLPTTGVNKGLLSWAVRYSDGTSEVNSQSTEWGYETASDPIVEAPVQRSARTKGDLSSIVIGLARGFNQPTENEDIDYHFWQGQWENTALLLPFKGSMEFNHPIALLNENNPGLEFYLARKEGGMSEMKGVEMDRYRPFFKIDPANPKRLLFELMPTNTGAGNAVAFGKSQWASNTKTFFSARVTVTFNPPFNTGWSSVLSSTTPNNDPTDGVTYIKPVIYVWHCLVAGTQIMMADGTTKAVETLNSDDTVLSSADGVTRKVLATLAQPHTGPIWTIALGSGKHLACSGTHPIVVPGGAVVQASSLKVGEQVLTIAGSEVITGVSESQQSGQGLFNLWLDPEVAGPTNMLAGGIWVGDYQQQVELGESAADDPELVRAKLPEDLLRDYESYLEDRAALKL